MFKQSLKLGSSTSLNNLAALLRSAARSASTEAVKKHKWDLLSAVCLERHPLIIKPMSAIESRFQKMLDDIEFHGSMRSDHEMAKIMEEKLKELQKAGDDVDMDISVKQTTQDFEDAGEVELAAFKLAPKITEADKKNIKNSLERKLDSCLVLLVEQKIGNENFWLPPQGNRVDGETMRQAAERVLKETCGDKLNVRIYGNAPIGFYKYVYPKTVRERGSHGAKVFYYLARYIDGTVPDTVKHLWLDREELQKTMPPPVHKSVSMFLVTE